MSNPFLLQPSEYTRDYNLPGAYVDQMVELLVSQTKDSHEECRKFVIENMRPGGLFPVQDPPAVTLVQESPGNRVKSNNTFLGYIGDVVKSGRIMSPTMTVYERPEVKESISAQYVTHGINSRGKAKKEMLIAGNMGNQVLKDIKNAEQNAKKIDINSISGMHGFAGNILYVKTGHPSLTSMCRSATSYGNSSNEQLIAGNRHYYNIDIVINYFLTVCTKTDFIAFANVMDTYKLHFPTAKEVMEAVKYSSDFYGVSDYDLEWLLGVFEEVEPIKLAAFLYCGDLYHLIKYNSDVVRVLFDKFCDVEFQPVDNPDAYLDALNKDPDLSALINYLNASITQDTNRGLVKENNPEGYAILGGCTKYISETIQEYADFIKVFFVLNYLPPSVADLRGVVRRVACTSDTDSTIFTTQQIVEWYTGSLKRSIKADRCWYVTTWIAIQRVTHVLAQFSGQMGVSADKIHMLAMKNEWSFPAYSITGRAKHYYALRSGQEGNVYGKYSSEIKGVGLRSSAVNKEIIADGEQMMLDILNTADRGEQLSVHQIYGRVWFHEQDIYKSIRAGESRFLKTGQIKSAYKNMASSPYQHYVLWQKVFAKRYGNAEPPPYDVLRLKLEINNKSDMENWLNSIEDKEIAVNLREFLASTGRTQISSMMLPVSALQRYGIPDEIMRVINVRAITYTTLESFYITMGSLGLHQVDERHARLISDIYTPPQEWQDHFNNTLGKRVI